MDRKIRDGLKKIYAAPEPVGKRAFFRSMQPQPVRIRYMLWIQAAYISKSAWLLSAVFLGVILFLSRYFDMIAFIAMIAMMPVLAAGSVSESVSSITYGMKELEMSARFSVKSVVLARLCILGTVNMIFAFTCAIFVQGRFMYTVLYLLVPYLAAVYLCLLVVRNIPGRDGIYACIGGSLGISMLAIYSIMSNYMWIYQERYIYVWIAAAAMLVYMDLKEGKHMISFIECSAI